MEEGEKTAEEALTWLQEQYDSCTDATEKEALRIVGEKLAVWLGYK